MKKYLLLGALAAAVWGEPQIRIFPLANRPAAATAEIVRAALSPGDQVWSDDRLQRLIVKAEPETLEKVKQLVEQLDVAAPQVWLRVTQSGDLQRSRSSLLQTGAVHQEVNGTQTLLVMSGEQGEIMIGQDLPTVQPYWNFVHGLSLIEPGVVFQRVSTGFAVEPTVVGDRVRLRVFPWMSYLSPGGRGRIEFSEAATSVTLADGETMTISSGSSQQGVQSRAFGLILGLGSESQASGNSITVSAEIKPE